MNIAAAGLFTSTLPLALLLARALLTVLFWVFGMHTHATKASEPVSPRPLPLSPTPDPAL